MMLGPTSGAARRAVSWRADAAHRLQPQRSRHGTARSRALLRMERPGTGSAVQPAPSGADVPRGDGGEGLPLQRLVRAGEGTAP